MKHLENQRGAVLIFVTLMIVLLLIMVGLGLDTGSLTYSRNQGQAAVDAAALSAVSGLPSRPYPDFHPEMMRRSKVVRPRIMQKTTTSGAPPTRSVAPMSAT